MKKRFIQTFNEQNVNLVSMNRKYIEGKMSSKIELLNSLKAAEYYVDFPARCLRQRWIYNWKMGNMSVLKSNFLIISL